MDLFEAIHTRRSIRKYQDRDIPDDLTQKLLAAAMMAPSTGDARPWHFVLIRDSDIKDRIKDVHPYVGMIGRAPLGILVCADLTQEKFPGFWTQDCSAAMQNLLLAAHASGLGAVWTGIYPVEERVERCKAICSLPEQIMPLGLAVLGWPAQQVSSKERFSKDRVHLNRWGEQAW